MSDRPYALEWMQVVQVFGKAREVPGHEFFDTEEARDEHARRLRENGITHITCYKRINGVMEEVAPEVDTHP